MRYLISTILIGLFFCSSAQGFRSRFYLPFAFNNASRVIFESSPKNYFAAVFVQDTLNGYSTSRLTIMGLDSIGQFLWAKKYGNAKFQYVLNNFVARSFYKQGNYIYHACCVRDSNNKQIGALLKFDFNGDTLWQKIFRDTVDGDDVIPQMVTGSVDGGYLITGFFQKWSPNGYNACLLIKTDANGNELWRKKLHKSAPNVSDGKAILQDSASGKIVIAGYQYKSGSSTYDNILILDSLGNIIIRRDYAGPAGGATFDMIQTSDQKIVIVGSEFDPLTKGSSNFERSYAVKFDLNTPFNPVPIWKMVFDKESSVNIFTCVREIENGEILIGGMKDTIDPVSELKNILIRMTIVDANGSIKSNRYYDYKINEPNKSNNMSLSSIEMEGNGSWLAAIQVMNTPAPNPFLFVKYDSTGCDSTFAYCKVMAEVGVEERQSVMADIKIFPNPAQTGFYLNYITQNTDVLFIEIKDIVGKIVFTAQSKSGQNNIYLPVENLSNGMYLITVTQNGKIIYNSKVVKEN